MHPLRYYYYTPAFQEAFIPKDADAFADAEVVISIARVAQVRLGLLVPRQAPEKQHTTPTSRTIPLPNPFQTLQSLIPLPAIRSRSTMLEHGTEEPD